MRKSLLLSLMFVVSLGAATQRPPVAACTSAIDACKTFVVLGKGPAKTMVYSSYPLTTRNDAVRRALIMVHGTNRNAHDYFNTAMAAAFLAGGLQDTIVVAPKLIVQSDPKVENEVVWPGGGDSWRSGGMSPTNADLSSFDVADELLRAFADKTVFPN